MGNFAEVKKENGIATIVMNNPKMGNCVDMDSYIDLEAAFSDVAADEDVAAVVFTGAGKHFSAGGNIKYFVDRVNRGEGFHAEEMSITSKVGFQIRRLEKPTVAMVNGCAYGAGCGLALACDFRIVAPSTSFSTAFIGLGLPGDTCGAYFLGKMLGAAKATELMMTGNPVTGEEAVRIGMATELVPEEQLAEAAYKLAGRLSRGPLKAYAQQKALINEFVYDLARFGEYGQKEAQAMSDATYTEDFREGVHAFLEKRRADFTGK